MATFEVGIRIDPEKGIAFFGVEDVNQRIAAGARVIELRPGGAIMNKVGEDGDNVRLALGGCQIQIVFEDA
jgi:hypothetical protein